MVYSAPVPDQLIIAAIEAQTSHVRRKSHAAPPPSVASQASPQAFANLTHAQNVALPLGHRDDAARIEKIENMACLDALVIGRQRHEVALLLAVRPAGGEIFLAGGFRHLELLEQHRGVGEFEIVPRIFLLGLQEDVAISDFLLVVAAVEVERVHVVDALHVHREPLEPICEFTRNGLAFECPQLAGNK